MQTETASAEVAYPPHWRALIAAPVVKKLDFRVLLQHVCTTVEVPHHSEEPNTKRGKQRANWIKQLNEAAHRLNDPSLRELSPRMDVIGDAYFLKECSNANFVRKPEKERLYFGKLQLGSGSGKILKKAFSA